MLGILILLFVGARFRRRGNSWPKVLLKTAGVYAIYLLLLYGGLFAAWWAHSAWLAPPIDRAQLSELTGRPRGAPTAIVPRPSPTPTATMPSGFTLLGPLPTMTAQQRADSTGTTTIDENGKAVQPRPRFGCDPAYPEPRTCIPPGPPFDQGCAITSERLFTVLPPDPQGLDHDQDGIGCEPIVSAPAPQPASSNPRPGPCDPSYPDVCIPPYPPDLDCRDVPYGNFRVLGADPHGLDGPYDGSNPYEPDGWGCEWN